MRRSNILTIICVLVVAAADAQIDSSMEVKIRKYLNHVDSIILGTFPSDFTKISERLDSTSIDRLDSNLIEIIEHIDSIDRSKSLKQLGHLNSNLVNVLRQLGKFLFVRGPNRSRYIFYDIQHSIRRKTYLKLLLEDIQNKLTIYRLYQSIFSLQGRDGRNIDTLYIQDSIFAQELIEFREYFTTKFDRDSSELEENNQRISALNGEISSLATLLRQDIRSREIKPTRLTFINVPWHFSNDNTFGLSLSYLTTDALEGQGWGLDLGLRFRNESKGLESNVPFAFVSRHRDMGPVWLGIGFGAALKDPFGFGAKFTLWDEIHEDLYWKVNLAYVQDLGLGLALGFGWHL